jgi:serine/threonine-protein phosphatase CPPED1
MLRFLLIFLSCLPLLAQDSRFFVQMADPQLGMFAKDVDSLQEEANLSFVVANINRLKPAFVIVCGDLINKTADRRQTDSYRQIIKGLNSRITIYNVAGNHDVGNHPTPASLAQYRKDFGKDYYSFNNAGVRGIVLNSSLIADPKNAPADAEAQEQWLLEQLRQAKHDKVQHLFVFQHASYFLQSPDEPDQYFNIPGPTRKRYLQWFHEYGVTHIFAGHYHRNAYGRDGNLEMITTGPVGKPLGRDQSGIRIVRLSGDSVENRYYELGSIPNHLDPAHSLPEFPVPRKAE